MKCPECGKEMEEDWDGSYNCEDCGLYGLKVNDDGDFYQELYEDEYGELEDAME